jgi:hypothetical protein
MRPEIGGSSLDELLSLSIKLGAVVLAGYLALTALCGFQLGRQIYQAKSNPFVGFGAVLIGRDATESLAIEQANLPPWITDSPSFWIALRVSE